MMKTCWSILALSALFATGLANNDTLHHRNLFGGSGCDWPIDLSLERDGSYSGDRTAAEAGASYRGRAGNAIITYMVARLGAATNGGFAAPWSGLLRIGVNGYSGKAPPPPESAAVWGPRFGKLSVCYAESGHPYPCPKGVSAPSLRGNKFPPSVAAQKCPSNDGKFRQNYNYFRGKRNATRYFMATADDLSPQELAAWENTMKPAKVWKPKPWLGPNDAVIHLRFFEDTRRVGKDEGTPCDHGDLKTRKLDCDANNSVSFACWNGLHRTHLCSWHSDLVEASLFTDGTCDKHVFSPPFEFYEQLFQKRAAREKAKGVVAEPGSVGGWDNVWLLSDPKGHQSVVAKRLAAELGVKVPFHHDDRGFAGPLEDIWNLKSAKFVIQSYGTFSWVGAFLSEAKEIHKPYTSNNWANYWAEEASLFVDDQPEYVYHNTEAGSYFETASEVSLNHPHSAFVKGLATRPEVLDMGPITSDPALCALAAGKWTPCSGGGRAESCAVRGKVVFRRPCQGTCFDKDL